MMAVVGTPTDEPYFQYQWNLKANGQNVEFDPNSPTFGQQIAVDGEDINVIPAWELGYTGQGVQVAIIAGGFDLTHPDLRFTTSGFSTPLDLLGGGPLPTIVDTTDSLGTALAGVVGARDNGEGIIGIAYGADIIPIRLDPGQFELLQPTIDAINQAIRFQAGFIQDGDGDGTVDDVLGGRLVQLGLDAEGRPILAQDPTLVTDVFLHSGQFMELPTVDDQGNITFVSSREADLLPVGPSTVNPLQTISIVDAIRETALGGRARYVDLNNDGIMTPNEITSLGSIHIVPAGDDGGRGTATPPFTPQGLWASSQYNQLANSIYTITVGGIDYDGQFENDATGTFTGIFEGGANVLIVAPTGTSDIDLNTALGLKTGLVTTDPTGDDGVNAAPAFNFEFDDDYFADTDYTSIAEGSQYAAAQAAAVVALMLEANPNLSYRDVQQILLMSARQADQFDESWITNQMREFRDEFSGVNYPIYAYYDIDTDGDGEADIGDAILPNPEYDAAARNFIHDRGLFTQAGYSIDLGVPFVYAPDPAVDDMDNPIFFLDDAGVEIRDEFGYRIPRFRTDIEGTEFSDADGLLFRATLDDDGVAQVSDAEDALPIVQIQVRTVLVPDPDDPDADPVPEEQTYIALLYEPNGNLLRPDVQAVDDEGEPAVDDAGDPIFVKAPSSLPINGIELANENIQVVGGSNLATPDPVLVWLENTVPDNAGINALTRPFVDFSQNVPLRFENGVGYTVSQGYGNSLEDVTYGHGVLDAELAVKLAIAWETNDLYLGESVTLTSSLLGGINELRVQPAVNIISNGAIVQTVPGGVTLPGGGDIDASYFQEFFSGITTTAVDAGLGEGNGEVITDAPFYDPDGDGFSSNRGTTRIPFQFDPSILTDFISIEHIEFTTNVAGGDVDTLRIAIVSPDGTQSELNAFRPPATGGLQAQNPQGDQGRQTPGEEAIYENFGGVDLNGTRGVDQNGNTIEPANDFINDSVLNQIIGVTTPVDALPVGQGYTWTTNRHWGEMLSLQGNPETEFDLTDLILSGLGNGPNGGGSSLDGWSLIIENHGFGEITLGGQYQITVHGTKATGNRIQGKIGIDDNKQGVDGTEADENFNFDRSVEMGLLQITLTDTSDPDYDPDNPAASQFTVQKSVVLDDANDSVTYTNTRTPAQNEFSLDRIYKTVAPDTGVEVLYPVIDRDDYFSATLADSILQDLQNFFRLTEGNDGLEVAGFLHLTQLDTYSTTADSEAINRAVSLGFYGERPTSFTAQPISYRNFDYSQESFASGVTVVATQYEVEYDVNGSAVSRTATGVVKKFTTGADGNYYFDVEANPEPPTPGTPAYLSWFNDFGSTFEYEISLDGVDSDRILTNEDGGGVGYFDVPSVGVVGFNAASKRYEVGINDAEDISKGVTTQIKNLNFLLTVDPAQTNATSSGVVYRDRNGDGVQQVGPEEGIAGVTVFHDANRNGVLDAGETSDVTDSNGAYSIVVSGLFSPQEVMIRVAASTLPAEFELFNPASGARALLATPGQVVSANFGVQLQGGEPAQVLGLVFNDLDQDGVQDVGEPGIGASTPVRIYLDFNGNGVWDPATEESAVTRADGSFVIESSLTGPVEVRFDTESTPLLQTGPATNGGGYNVTLVDGQTVTGLVFGAFDARDSDFGDLFVDPDFGVSGARYPTLLRDNGARHVVVPGMSLGALVDVDDNGFQSPVRDPAVDGQGDNLDNLADEDGVTLVSSTIRPSSTIEFDIVANGGGAVLNAWIDFNADGDWDDPGEQVFTDVEDLGTGQPIRLIANTPSAVSGTADYLAARFRWGPFGLSYDGAANAGEVEDYLLPRQDLSLTVGLVGDYNGDRLVNQADYDYWSANYGSTTILGADGNGNGRVDAGDYSVWRDAYSRAQAAPAFATAAAPTPGRIVDLTHLSLSPANVPQPVTMPVEAYEEPAAAPAPVLALFAVGEANVVDESLAELDAADADSLDSALLLLSLGGDASDEADPIDDAAQAEEPKADEEEVTFDEVFAV